MNAIVRLCTRPLRVADGLLAADRLRCAQDDAARVPCEWAAMIPALTALGPVLHVDCSPAATTGLERMRQAPRPACAELIGLVCAAGVRACVVLDSDGPRESLHFFDADGTLLAGIWLLPDSDFLAWERLMSALPSAATQEPPARSRWQRHAFRGVARVRCLERVRMRDGELLDARTPPRLSAIGQGRARHIAAAVGARLDEAVALA